MRSLHIAMKSSPRSPQLEKACAQQQRPNTAKNKLKKFLIKKKKLLLLIHECIDHLLCARHWGYKCESSCDVVERPLNLKLKYLIQILTLLLTSYGSWHIVGKQQMFVE